MNISPGASTKGALSKASVINEKLAVIFNSEVVRSDAVAQRIIAGLRQCEGTAEVNIVLEQLCSRLMQIENTHMASIGVQSQPKSPSLRPTHSRRLSIRL